jgi:Acetyltransferase (GNAT) domain
MPDNERVVYLTRSKINDAAWNTCLANAPNQVLYGYSWYLDAVTCLPDWTWAGLVIANKSGEYEAVMPVPLRQKFVGGIAVGWVVHQPLFCQFLGVFGPADSNPAPFFRALLRQFRYGSILQTAQKPPTDLGLSVQEQHTQLLNLGLPYPVLLANYSADRQQNLQRAQRFGWQIAHSTDPEPLIRLFQENHAQQISGGVGSWAYMVFREVVLALQQRGLANIQYAYLNKNIEAGALFVRDKNRIIYLFNAASATGRKGNARTLLLDNVIQKNAQTPGLWFDFESPNKPSIAEFYKSFGAEKQPFWATRWNRLSGPAQVLLRLFHLLEMSRPKTQAR